MRDNNCTSVVGMWAVAVLVMALSITSSCDDGPELTAEPTFVGPERVEYYPTICVGQPVAQADGYVAVPVTMERREGVRAFGMGIYYQPEMLRYVGTLRGPLLRDWLMFGAKMNEPGTVRVGGFNLTPIEAANGGRLFTMIFIVLEPGYATFIAADFVDDIEEATNCVTVIEN